MPDSNVKVFQLRVPTKLHAAVKNISAREGTSIHQFTLDALREACVMRNQKIDEELDKFQSLVRQILVEEGLVSEE